MTESGIILITIGVVINFLGWALYRISLKVSGVVAGVILGAVIAIMILSSHTEWQSYSIIIFPLCLIVFGFIGKAFIKRLNILVMFILGSSLAITAGERFLGDIFLKLLDRFIPSSSRALEIIIMNIVLGFAGGVFAVILQKYIFILVTSIVGSLCIHNGIGFDHDNLLALSFILLLGIATQLGMFKWLDGKYDVGEKDDEDE